MSLPEGPWEKVAVDPKGPLQKGRYKYLLVSQEDYSKWPEVLGLTWITSTAIIERLKRVFSRFGLPKILVVNNGTQLCSKQIKDFLASLKIKHRPVALYAPMQNGLVERFNRIIAEKLQEAKKFG